MLRAVGYPPVLSGLWGALLCAEGCGVPSYVLSGLGVPSCVRRGYGSLPVPPGGRWASSVEETGEWLLLGQAGAHEVARVLEFQL